MEKLFYQQQRKGCGYACVKMLLFHYTHKLSVFNIIEPPIQLESPSINDVISFASNYGLCLHAYRVTNKRDLLKNKVFPLLIVIEENRLVHMVYLIRHRNKHYVVLDPENGKRVIDEKEFVDLFTGVYLECVNYKKGVYTKAKSLLPYNNLVSSSLLEIGSMLCIFFGFYFVSENGNFLAPLILFSAFVFLKLLQRLLLKQNMKEFDALYSKKIEDKNKEIKRDKFVFYNSFKSAFFSGPISILSVFIEIVFFSVILSLNDMWFALGLLISLTVSFSSFLFLYRYEKNLEKKLEEKENNYFKLEGDDIYLKSIFKEAYKIAGRKEIKEMIFIFLELVICLLICLLNQKIQLNYLLFSLMSLVYINNRFTYLMEKSVAITDYKKNEAKFIGYFVSK